MLVGFSADMSQHLTVSTCFTLPQQLHTSRNRSIALHHGSRVCTVEALPSPACLQKWDGKELSPSSQSLRSPLGRASRPFSKEKLDLSGWQCGTNYTAILF